MAYIGNSPDTIQRGRRFIYEFTATAGQTVFSGADDNNQTLDLLEANEQSVFLNGVRLIPTDDYTVSGDILTLTSAASLNDFLVVETQAEVANISTYTRAESDARYVNYNGDIISGDLQITGNVSVASGNISLGDTDKVIFGAGNDLQIYHDPATGNSHITESGSGQMVIRGNDIYIQNEAGTQSHIVAANNASVSLGYAGTTKISTTSTGIDVSGTVTADGLTVDGISALNNNVTITQSASPTLTFTSYPSTQDTVATIYSGRAEFSGTNSFLRFGTNDGTSTKLRLDINQGGDISFYEDTGTTAKFFWDASAERLGIGTSSPSRQLHLSGSGVNTRLRVENTTGSNVLDVYAEDGGNSTLNYSSVLTMSQSGTERMRIDSSGNVLVGTTSYDNNVVGIGLSADNYLYVARQRNTANSSRVATFNRKGTNGPIVDFLKDGTVIGNIANASTDLEIYTPNQSGIALKGNNVSPMYQSAQSDNQTDLGRSANRWRDLFLSGGVYVGGTGSANYLDDYEEGTWTAQLYDNSGNGPSSTTATGYYTKVGRVVHAMVAQFTNISTSGLSGILRMSLPFTPATGGFYSSGTAVMLSGSFPSNTYALRASIYHGETRAYFQAVGTSGATSLSTSNITSGTTDISQITFSYITA